MQWKRLAASAAAAIGLVAGTGLARAQGTTLRLGMDRAPTASGVGLDGGARTLTLEMTENDAQTLAVRGGHGGGGHGGGGRGGFHGGGGHGGFRGGHVGGFRGGNVGGLHGRGFGNFGGRNFGNFRSFNNVRGFGRGGWGGYGRGWGGGWGGYGWGWGGGWGNNWGGWGWPWSWGGYYPSYYYNSYPSYSYYGYDNYLPYNYSYPNYYYYPSTYNIAAPQGYAQQPVMPSPSYTRNPYARMPSMPPGAPRSNYAAPPAGQLPDGTYPYDGGPANPVPMPQAVPLKPQTAPAPANPTVPVEGRSVSLPARSRAQPARFAYPAYGDVPVRADFAQDRALVNRGK